MVRRLVAVALTFPLVAGSCAAANEPQQPPIGPVIDLANIIPEADEARLDSKLRAYFRENCIAIIVASTPSLEGQDIDSYGNRLANSWNISDPGALVLVAPTGRKVRLELSRAVNTVISDSAAQQVIDEAFLPHYRAGNMALGTIEGTEAMIARLDANRGKDGLNRTSCRSLKAAA
jgi:uncharacterized protein